MIIHMYGITPEFRIEHHPFLSRRELKPLQREHRASMGAQQGSLEEARREYIEP